MSASIQVISTNNYDGSPLIVFSTETERLDCLIHPILPKVSSKNCVQFICLADWSLIAVKELKDFVRSTKFDFKKLIGYSLRP
jgi:hypothetical protein